MEIIIKDNYQELSESAAKIIKNAIKEKPNLVLGLATGSTPLGCYQELIRMNHEKEIDFSKVIIFNLDEYLGLSKDHSQSYNYFMRKIFLNQINFDLKNFYIPDGTTKEVEKFCREYEEKIKNVGGIDLQILGIGSDGHIGFNEPGTPLDSRTHLAELVESTIKDNARFFEKEEDVPRFAITMGVETIFESKKIVLLASGGNKADACVNFIKGPVNSEVTASILQKHSNTIIILDKDAAFKLKNNF